MMRLRPFAPLALSLLLAGGATAALAQTPMDPLDARDARRLDKMEQVVRELRSIVFQGRDSGKPVVVQPAETDYQLQELNRKLDDLQQSFTRMNGQLEVTSHDLAQAKKEADGLRAENKALSDRVQALEQAQAAAAAPPSDAPATSSGLAAGPPPEARPARSASDTFSSARQSMLSGDYTAAESGFQDYVDRFGDSPKAPEARYWLGKTQAARAAYSDAAGSFIGAIRGWPQTSWAPDALVELSRALVQLRKPNDACQALAELDRRYPKAPPAVRSRAASARTQAKCGA